MRIKMRRTFLMRKATALSAAVLTLALALTPAGAQRRGAGANAATQAEAQKFIDSYTSQYLPLRYAASQAEWVSNTHSVEGDSTNEKATVAANEKLSACDAA